MLARSNPRPRPQRNNSGKKIFAVIRECLAINEEVRITKIKSRETEELSPALQRWGGTTFEREPLQEAA